jgi:transposase-like protein
VNSFAILFAIESRRSSLSIQSSHPCDRRPWRIKCKSQNGSSSAAQKKEIYMRTIASERTALSSVPMIPVFPRREVRAFPGFDHGAFARYMDLGLALTSVFPTDVHFAAYHVPSIPRRLSSDALGHVEGGVPMVALVFDVDDEEAHRRQTPSTHAWFARELPKLERLFFKHPHGFAYRTKGGYRIVYLLEPVFRIADDEDRRAWTKRYVRELCYLARRFGIIGDPACRDWTRLFRLPHGTREAGRGPELRGIIGDPAALGAWGHALEADVSADAALATQLSARRSEWSSVGRLLSPPPPRLSRSPGSSSWKFSPIPRGGLRMGRFSLQAAVRAILRTREGRNNELNRQAFCLGRFVQAGALPEALVVETLADAGRRSGLDENEILPSIRSGLAAAARVQ